eukprot:7439397-Pyramimonas_sp.AAC.1
MPLGVCLRPTVPASANLAAGSKRVTHTSVPLDDPRSKYVMSPQSWASQESHRIFSIVRHRRATYNPSICTCDCSSTSSNKGEGTLREGGERMIWVA